MAGKVVVVYRADVAKEDVLKHVLPLVGAKLGIDLGEGDDSRQLVSYLRLFHSLVLTGVSVIDKGNPSGPPILLFADYGTMLIVLRTRGFSDKHFCIFRGCWGRAKELSNVHFSKCSSDAHELFTTEEGMRMVTGMVLIRHLWKQDGKKKIDFTRLFELAKEMRKSSPKEKIEAVFTSYLRVAVVATANGRLSVKIQSQIQSVSGAEDVCDVTGCWRKACDHLPKIVARSKSDSSH